MFKYIIKKILKIKANDLLLIFLYIFLIVAFIIMKSLP